MFLSFILALQAIAAPAAGRPQPPATILAEPAALMLAACDANGDARVTVAERDACVARSFATAEGAATGSIGYIAFADWAQAWLGDRNALPSPYEVDRDGDNRITPSELQATFARYFDRYDVNRDGVLVRSELITIRAAAPRTRDAQDKRKGRR